MPFVIQMPKLGHAMTEGTVLRWHKRAGDKVAQGDPVLTVETDKAEVEVEAPAEGVIARLAAAEGDVVQVGGELAVIALKGESIPADEPKAKSAAVPQSAALAAARREKLTRIQAVGARNLTQSWQQIPHFVQMVRVDMSQAMQRRRSLNAGGAKITVTDLILAAVVRALGENPRVNASYSDGEMLIYDRINLGIAVDTPDGLVVPVIHDAQSMDLQAISARASELAGKAREKKLMPRDLEGATFTVSNLGAYGVENGTPVIFAPQAALMFVGAIRDEVLAVEGKPEIRPAMQIAIAYDHRGIDGATASRFTTRVKQLL